MFPGPQLQDAPPAADKAWHGATRAHLSPLGGIATSARRCQASSDRAYRFQQTAMHLEDGVVGISTVWLVAHRPVLAPAAVEASNVRPANSCLASVPLVQGRNALAPQHAHHCMCPTPPAAIDQQSRRCAHNAAGAGFSLCKWAWRVIEEGDRATKLHPKKSHRLASDVRRRHHRWNSERNERGCVGGQRQQGVINRLVTLMRLPRRVCGCARVCEPTRESCVCGKRYPDSAPPRARHFARVEKPQPHSHKHPRGGKQLCPAAASAAAAPKLALLAWLAASRSRRVSRVQGSRIFPSRARPGTVNDLESGVPANQTLCPQHWVWFRIQTRVPAPSMQLQQNGPSWALTDNTEEQQHSLSIMLSWI